MVENNLPADGVHHPPVLFGIDPIQANNPEHWDNGKEIKKKRGYKLYSCYMLKLEATSHRVSQKKIGLVSEDRERVTPQG